MARKRSAANGSAGRLSEKEFDAKYWPETQEGGEADEGVGWSNVPKRLEAIEKGDYQPRSPIWFALPHLNDWWLVRQLRSAARENSPEAYASRLDYFLTQFLCAEPPEGVINWPSRRPGAPWKPETGMLYSKWVDAGKPPLNWYTCDTLAADVYPDEAREARSDIKKRKNLRDRVGGEFVNHAAIGV
jgi:hypothetical protein